MKVMAMDEYHEQIMHRDGKRDTLTVNMRGGLVILAEDGRPLYDLRLMEDGVSLELRTAHIVKVKGKVMDSTISIAPHSSNVVIITRPEYK